MNLVRSCLAVILIGAASVGPAHGIQTPGAKTDGTSADTSPTYDYALAGGDKLRVIVFDEPKLGGDFTVSGAGTISMPLIGDVIARGLTAPQLQQRVTARLADGYLKTPRVAIEVLTTRPYYILGEVNKPGEYAFADGLTVNAAVARAGGFTYRAKTGEVKIKHVGENKVHEYNLGAATPVRPGDTIRIEERWF